MPTFKEVQELRKSGNLDEAHALAKEMMQSDSTNIWNLRAIAWVYYDYLKMYAEPNSFETFIEYLDKIKQLNLPEDEKMIFDNCSSQISKLVFAIQREQNVNYQSINRLFDYIKEFHLTKPSEIYSFLYKAFHKGYQNWNRYIEFADWWNFENFRSEDFLEGELNGKKLMPTAEQAYIAYSKKLLEGESTGEFQAHRKLNKEKINAFLPKLDIIINSYPQYQYPAYFKAKLLIALHSGDQVLPVFLPFAKQKRNNFWVWEMMAGIFEEDKEIQFACYCKALSLITPEDFLVKLRQTMAQILIERKLFAEAKTEIQLVIETREKNKWKVPDSILRWTSQDWYKSASSFDDNYALYSKNLKKADEIFFNDIEEEVIVIEFVNEHKDMAHFVKNKNKHGFFKYTNLLDKPEIGDTIKVRFKGTSENSFYKVITAKKTEEETTCEAILKFEGNLNIIPPNTFGFVGDIFIEPNFIQKQNLTNGQQVSGKAILSFNKRKNEWGWKALLVQ